MRKLVYYVACSLDGFIAREDGSFDFALPDGAHLQDLMRRFPETFPGHLRGALGVSGPNQSFDTVLMGRGTYEVGLTLGITSPYPHLRQYLFSRTITSAPDPGVALMRDDPAATVRRLKQESGKDLWLCGGAKLAAALFGEIDELILKINPVIIGTGIPLVAGRHEARVDLVDIHTYANGVMVSRYRVHRPST
jgi:dihydrofolate reductase